VYKDIWLPLRGETLACQREEGNVYDPFAVKVVKSGVIVGHVPRRISSTCSLFLRHGGTITCKITDPKKRYSRDLEHGGLEIPCLLLFQAESELLAKVQKLLSLSEKNFTVGKQSERDHDDEKAVAIKYKIKQEPEHCLPEAKRIKVEDEHEDQISLQEIWATCAGSQIKLFQEDKCTLERDRLNDRHINFVQALLKNQFSLCNGLQNTLLQGRHTYDVNTKIVQILHVRDNHWIVISNLLCPDNEVRYYDTVYSDIDQQTHDLLKNMLGDDVTVTVDSQVQKQKGDKDCGVFCIAIATSLLHNQSPGPFTQSLLRPHLIYCIENKSMIPFP